MSGHIPVEPESNYVEIPVVVNELRFIPGESVVIECFGCRKPVTIIRESTDYLEYSIESTETPGEQKSYTINKSTESPMKFYGLKTRLISPYGTFGIPMPTTEEFTRDYVEIPLVKGNFTFIPGESVIMAQNDSRTDIPEYTPVWSLTIASDSADKFEYITNNTSNPNIISSEKTERKGIKLYRLKSGLGGGRKKSRRYKTRRYKRSRLSRRKKHH